MLGHPDTSDPTIPHPYSYLKRDLLFGPPILYNVRKGQADTARARHDSRLQRGWRSLWKLSVHFLLGSHLRILCILFRSLCCLF